MRDRFKWSHIERISFGQKGGKTMADSKKNLCVFRVRMLDSKGSKSGSLAGALYHLDNHKEAADIRPEREHLENVSVKSCLEKFPDYKTAKAKMNELKENHNKAVDDFNAKNPSKKRRKMKDGQSQAFEVVMSFSPGMEQEIDFVKWSQAQIKFLEKEYISKGCIPVRFEVHRDESTMHCHAILLCWDKEKQISSASQTLGNKYDLSRLQTRYADEMKGFGLARGRNYLEEYEAVRRPAFKEAGITKRPKDREEEKRIVADYCKRHNIAMPRRNYHESFREHKARKQRMLMQLEQIESDIERKTRINEMLSKEEDIHEIFSTLDEAEDIIKTARESFIHDKDGKQISLYDFLQDEYKRHQEKTLADRILADDEYMGFDDDESFDYDHAPGRDDEER